MTGACTNPIYYQGLDHVALYYFLGLKHGRSSHTHFYHAIVPVFPVTVRFRDTLSVTISELFNLNSGRVDSICITVICLGHCHHVIPLPRVFESRESLC
jgi:hypothetical protein